VFLNFQDRQSDSPFVERVWRSYSERGGTFVSVAAANFEIAVTRHRGRRFLTLRGPETKATAVVCPPDGEWLGIRFKLGPAEVLGMLAAILPLCPLTAAVQTYIGTYARSYLSRDAAS